MSCCSWAGAGAGAGGGSSCWAGSWARVGAGAGSGCLVSSGALVASGAEAVAVAVVSGAGAGVASWAGPSSCFLPWSFLLFTQILVQQSREIHPAPLFSLPHPAVEPVPLLSSTMVKTPLPVKLPVVG